MDEGVLEKVCKFLKGQKDNEAIFPVFWKRTKDLYPEGLSKNKLKTWLKGHPDRFEIIANKDGNPFGKIKLKVQATGVLPVITEDDQITQKLIECIDNKDENGHLFGNICKNKAQIFPEKLQDKKYIRNWLVEHENYFKMVNDANGGLYLVEVKEQARNVGKLHLLPPAASHSKTSESVPKPPKTENTNSNVDLLKMADDMELRISQAIQKKGGTMPFDALLKANDVIYPLSDEESLRLFLSHFPSKFEIINVKGKGEWVNSLPSKNMSFEIVKTNITNTEVKKPQPDHEVEVKKKRSCTQRSKKKSDQASSSADDASSGETDSNVGDFDNNSFASSSQKPTPSLLSSDSIQKSHLATSLTGYEKVENWMGTRRESYQSRAPIETWDKQSDSESVSSGVSFQSSVPSVQCLWQDDLQKVFITILEKYNGNAPFNRIVKEKDLFGGVDDVEKWFEKYPQQFILHRNEEGKIDTVSSFSKKSRICLNYSCKHGCSKHNCQFYHICRDYVEGRCRKGDRCHLNHDLNSEQVSKQVAKHTCLQHLSPSQLLTLIRVSVPSVCHYHNQRGCKRGDFCPNIHVCKIFVKWHQCRAKEACKYGHEEALKQEPAKRILKMYNLYRNKEPDERKLKYIKRNIFVFDTRKRGSGQRKSVGTQPKVQDEKQAPNEPRDLSGLMDVDLTVVTDSPAQEPEDIVPSICHKFLTDECPQCKKCSDVHFGLPYCWQFKLADIAGSRWENFDTTDCENIEKYFCDEKCNATELSISTKITEDMSSIRLDFQSMSGRCQASSGFKIRRLECKGKVQHENEAWCQTKWMWYKFESSRWIQCEDIKANVYEEAFLDGMRQVDRSINRRRPSCFLPASQVEEKKRETKEQQMSEGAATLILCRPVSNDPPQCKPGSSIENISPAEPINCYRTRVISGSLEYKTVENLCNFSDRTGVIIKKIERIRSDVLSTKYASKRKSTTDKLLPGELPNERYLFVPCLNEDIQRIMNGNISESRIVSPRPFGRGHYFTSDASLCLEWCREHTTYSQYSLIVCQVLLGASIQGTRDLTGLPRQPDGRFYDSLVDAMDNPTVFMIEDVDQCYPTFIIDFSYAPAPANEVEENVDCGLTIQPQHSYPHVSQSVPTYHHESPRIHTSTHPLGTLYTSQSTNESSVVPRQAPLTPNIPSSPVDYVKASPQPPPYSERSDPPPAYTPCLQTARTTQAEVPRSRNVRQTPAPRQSGGVKDDKCLVM